MWKIRFQYFATCNFQWKWKSKGHFFLWTMEGKGAIRWSFFDIFPAKSFELRTIASPLVPEVKSVEVSDSQRTIKMSTVLDFIMEVNIFRCYGFNFWLRWYTLYLTVIMRLHDFLYPLRLFISKCTYLSTWDFIFFSINNQKKAYLLFWLALSFCTNSLPS